MALTGKDLLKKLNSTNNIKDKDKEDEKKEESALSGADLLGKLESYQSTNFEDVNEEYINSFVSDASDFFKKYESGDSSITYSSANSTLADLDTRYNTINWWLDQNKSKFDEKTYSSYKDTFDGFGSGIKSIKDYYSQWDSEGAFNIYADYEKKRSEADALDSTALSQKLSDYRKVQRIQDEINKVKLNTEKLYGIFRSNGYTESQATAKVKEAEAYANAEIAKLQEQLDQYGGLNAIAYTTPEGNNVTWQSLYDKRKQEEEHAALYASVSGNADFKVSVDSATGYINPDITTAEKGKSIVNKVKYYEDNAMDIKLGEANGSGSSIVHSRISFMTDEEKDIYNYYFGRGEYDKAEAYLASIDASLKKRFEGWEVESVSQLADKHPVMASALSVFANAASGAEYISDLFKYASTGELDTNHLANISSSIRETVSGKVDWEIGSWDAFDFVYNTGMSMADSMASMGMFGGAGGVSLGLSAAAQATNDALNRGMSNEQAFWNGFTSGVFEGLFETLSIGQFSALKESFASSGMQIIKNIGKSMLVNATEETLTELANITYDYIANGDFSNYEASIRLYMASGMTEAEAKKQTALDLGLQVAESAGSGALMGIGFGGIGSVSQYRNSNKNAKELHGDGADLVSEALDIDPNNAYANKLKARLDKGKSLSGMQLNRLSQANDAAKTAEDTAKMKSATEARLSELGEKGDIGALVDIIVKQASGEKLTKAEAKVLENSKYGQRVANELSPTNIEAGTHSSAWAENIGTSYINEGAYNKELYALATEKEGVTEIPKALAKETPSATNSTTATKASTQSEFKASEEGKTINTTTGEDVSIKGIASNKGGSLLLELENGNIINAKELSFGTREEALLYEMVTDMEVSPQTAKALIKGFKATDGVSAEAYAIDIPLAYKYGQINLKQGLEKLHLTSEQKNTAFLLGRDDVKASGRTWSNTSRRAGDVTKAKASKDGIIYEGFTLNEDSLTDIQKASLAGVRTIAKMSSLEIHVYEGVFEKGKRYAIVNGQKRVAPNGYFRDGNRIFIDINAGGIGTMLYTLSHEGTHYIAENSWEDFLALADFLFEEYSNHNAPVEDLINQEIAKLKTSYLRDKKALPSENVLYMKAYEEVVAEAMSEMFADHNAYVKLAKLKSENLSLWQKIGEAIKMLLDKLKSLLGVYSNLTPDAMAATYVRDFSTEAYNKLQDLYLKAFANADKNFEASQATETDGESDTNYSYSSIAYSFFGDKKVTIKDFENGSYKDTEGYKKYVDTCLNNMRQTIDGFNEKAALKEIEDSIAGIVDVAVAMKKAGYDILDNNAKRSTRDSKNRLLFSSLEPNSDYFTSSDISTICDKRINFAEIYDEIVRREEALGVKKGKRFFDNVDNYFILHKIMADKGLTQPCRQCYVESMRKNLAPMANAFLKLVQETDPNNKANDQLFHPKGKNKGQSKTNNAKLRESLLEAIANEEYDITADKLTVEMLTTEDGLAKLKLQAPLIYEAFNSFYGQSKPKMPKSATPFRFGELTALLTDNKGKIKTGLIKQIMSTGGFRLQSYSDFQIQNFADVLQVIFEAGTLGLSGHAYTKVPAFLDATKGTNLKRNISIFMYKDGGQWKLDRNDSFPYDLDAIYDIVKSDKSGDTSIIAVVQNEDMAAWIMANDNVGYFIPFHKSGLKMGTVRETIVREGGREIKGYSGIKDHTRQQTEVWASANADHKALTKVKKGINIYEDGLWDFDNVDNLSQKDLIKKNIMAYIDACNERGYLPKFREYVMNNSKVLNAVLNYSKQLGFVAQDATIDDISFEYSGYRIPYGYYKCLGDFGMFTPDGEASPIKRLSLKDYKFDEAVKFFSDAKTLRRNEILQQISNGEERERYRTGDKKNMTTAEIAEEVQAKRNQVVEDVVSGDYKKKKSADGDTVYSDSDSDGNPLSAEQQEFFKDSEVRWGSKLMPVYHGTREEFTVFDSSMAYDAHREGGLLWAAKDYEYAKDYSFSDEPIVMKGYLNATNLLDIGDIDSYSDYDKRLQEIADLVQLTPSDLVKMVNFKNARIYDITSSKGFKDRIVELGYDGVTALESGLQTFGFVNSNQFKSVDNKTPTSDPDINYSDADPEYFDALNRGDMDTAQKIIDEAAKKAGYKKLFYHGTSNGEFTKFITHGKPIWITDSREYAEVYAKNKDPKHYKMDEKVMPLYAKMDNTIDVTSVWTNQYAFRDYDNYSPTKYTKELADIVGVDASILSNIGKKYDALYVYEIINTKEFADLIREKGYDSIKQEEYGNITYGVLESAQLKSADVVTYSKQKVFPFFTKKNRIPVSERFNSENDDILYSESVLMGSLFSGGGTLEAGLVYQMLDKEFAVEYNKKIASAYTDNYGKEHMFVGDVRDFNSKEKQSVFYLHASPVCKNFSPASHSGGETTLDITTAQATARVLEEQMPQVFTVENVKRYKGSEAYNIITDKLNELGYVWDVDVYKASDYGNATKRERMIIRAVKDGQLPEKPQKASNITSWGEATRDLWETELKPSYLVRSKIEAIKNTPGLKGVKLTKLDKPLLIYDTTKSKTAIYAWADELAPTLTTKCGDARIIMPDGRVYAPTPKFMGRIQGLPDDYKYPKAVTNAFKIIGNGIPTQLTKSVIGGVLDSAYAQTHDGEALYSEGNVGSTIYIKDGHTEDGETVNFIDLILDGKKKGETRSHKNLTRKWVGIAKDGYVYGRVRLGEPKLINKNSPEYEDSFIEGTEYDLKDNESKYYYPILEIEDFRDNPKRIERNGNYGTYRYSEADTESVSNRSLLANALEGVAQNDIERNKLAQYKDKLALIESEQEKLSKVKKEANDLRFTKGRTADETKRMKDLEFEANQIANRINTYDRQLFNLESTSALKGVLEREKQLARKKAEKRGKEILAAQREKSAKTQRELLTRYQESRAKAVDSRNRTQMRHKIKSVVSDLNNLLLHGTKERNVKLGLQIAVASALEAVNMDTIAAEERIAKLREDLMKAKTPEKIQEISRKIDNLQAQGDNMASKLEELRRAYVEIKASNENIPEHYKQEAALIADKVDDTISKVGNTPLRNMSLAQLEAVYELYKIVLTTVRNTNAVFKQGKLDDLHNNVSAIMMEVSPLKTLKEERSAVGEWWRKQSWNEMIPVYAFERIGSKTLTSFFWETIQGQNTFARDVKEAEVFSTSVRDKYGYGKWDFDKIHEFKLADGRTFRVSLKHMMSIYAYSKRDQAIEHMRVGGFFFNDKETFRKKGGILKMIKSNEEGYYVDDAVLDAIIGKRNENGEVIKEGAMTRDQLAYVDEMQDYLTKMGEKGNEVSRVLWGIDIFKEKVYFPLKSSKDFLYQSNQPSQASSLKNDGMTKETKPGASNPIVLEAFDEVWANHVNRMSMYHSFVLPIENLNKIHNYGSWVGTASMSVSTMLGARHGEAVNEYITQFIQDLNGASSMHGVSNPLFGFVGKFKKVAVAASTSVVVQQPTAILRALAVMDAKYFVGKPNIKTLSSKWAELQKYAPIAVIKEIGGFDAGGGRQATSWLNDNTRRGLDKVMGKVDDLTMVGAALGDQLGWTTIWEACKREIKATTNLTEGTEEFLTKAGERFTEVIVLTQVYDSTLSRSGFMRSKHESMKMLTAFMGEPTVSFNMLMSAVIHSKRKTISKKKAARIIGSVYASVLAASIASSMIYALRDDDDDESYLEKLAEALSGKLIDELNPVNMLPIARDLMSILDGWDVERTDVAIFKDLKDAFDGLSSDNKSAWRKTEDFAGAIASLFGVPLKNTLRTGREVYNFFKNIFDDIAPSGVGDAFVRGITGEKKDSSKALYEAIVNKDDARLKIYRDNYKDDKSYKTAVSSALRANDPRIKKAAQARFNGDIDEYKRIAYAIIGEGYFDQDTVVSAINSEITALKNGESTEGEESGNEDKATSIFSASDINNAYENGDYDTAREVIEDLIATKVANGMEEKNAKSSLRSSMTSYWKALYKEAYASGDSSEMKRIREILYNSGLYGTANDVVKTCQDWLKD